MPKVPLVLETLKSPEAGPSMVTKGVTFQGKYQKALGLNWDQQLVGIEGHQIDRGTPQEGDAQGQVESQKLCVWGGADQKKIEASSQFVQQLYVMRRGMLMAKDGQGQGLQVLQQQVGAVPD